MCVEGVGGQEETPQLQGLGCLLFLLGEQIMDLGPSLGSPGQKDNNHSNEDIFWVDIGDLEEIKKVLSCLLLKSILS